MSARRLLHALLIGLVIVAAVQPAFSQDADGEASEDAEQAVPVHPLTNLPASSSDVRATYILPDVSNNVVFIGEATTVVCGFQNVGSKSINVTGIIASLNSPFQFNVFVQNFTSRPYGRVIEGGAEGSFEYRFITAKDLEPMDLQLAVTVFYEDDAAVYSSTFFNQTVTFEDRKASFDFGALLKPIGYAGALIWVFVVIKGSSTTSKKSKAKAAKATAASAESTAVEGEFAEEFLQRSAGKAAKAKKTA